MTQLPEGLPELPQPTLETNGDVFGHENEEGYTADQMRQYGLACYRAGLEKAAEYAELYDLGTVEGHEIAAAIRSLKKP